MPRRPDLGSSLDLALVAGATLLLVVLAGVASDSPLRGLLGVPFALLLPGWALTAVLYPGRHRTDVVDRGLTGMEREVRKEGVDPLERLAFSLGASVAVVPLMGLVLDATAWGLRPFPLVASVAGFTLLACAVAWVRRRRLPVEDRFHLGAIVGTSFAWGSRPRRSKVAAGLLAASLLVAGASVAYVLANPPNSEAFTAFYVLGPDGTAADLPTALDRNETTEVTLGVRNHEGQEAAYAVEAWLANATDGVADPEGDAELEDLFFLERWTTSLESHDPGAEDAPPVDAVFETTWTFALDRPGNWTLTWVLHADHASEAPLDPDLDRDVDHAGTDAEERWRDPYRSLRTPVIVG